MLRCRRPLDGLLRKRLLSAAAGLQNNKNHSHSQSSHYAAIVSHNNPIGTNTRTACQQQRFCFSSLSATKEKENDEHEDEIDNVNSSSSSSSSTTTSTTSTTSTTTAAIKTQQQSDQSPPMSRDSLMRLAELSRQEWTLIGLSASTLLVTSSVTLLFPFASGTVIDYTVQVNNAVGGADGSGGGGIMSPILLASGLFGLSALAGGGVYLRTLWLAKAGNRIVARLRQGLYASILQQESAYFDQPTTTTGDLLSRLTSDAQLVQSAVTTQAVAGLRGIVMSTGAASMLLYTSPALAAISCCTLPPIFIATRQFGRRLSKQQEQVQELLGEATTLAEQSLGATTMATVKQFVAEDFESNRYRNAIAAAHAKAVETAHMQAQLEAGAHIAGNAAILGVLGYGGTLVLDGSISAGDLTGFVMYSLMLAGNLSGLTSVYSDMIRAVAASNRILDIMDREPKITRSTNGHRIQSSPKENVSTLLAQQDPLVAIDYVVAPPKHSKDDDSTSTSSSSTAMMVQAPLIEIQGLDFRYPARPDIPVLKDFNLTVLPGEVIALVGGSGSGKSTIGSLLTRLYDVEDGGATGNTDTGTGTGTDPGINNSHSMIRIDGRPISDYDIQHLRRDMIGIVSQDPVLFRGTIRENIRYGEWGNVSEEDILKAAKQAHVLDFAEKFPDGLDTMVGARGMQLSGGQRQRIALARVLAKNSPILILDEATSALDAQSEHLVQQALQSLFSGENSNGRTIISIAHRLSTIRHASRIAVIQDGTVVQTGPFDQLRSVDGPFRELMKTQLVGEIDPA